MRLCILNNHTQHECPIRAFKGNMKDIHLAKKLKRGNRMGKELGFRIVT